MKSCLVTQKRICSSATRCFITLEAMVRDFIVTHRKNEQDELMLFKQLTLKRALKCAALAEDLKKRRFAHQRRLTAESLRQGKRDIMRNQTAFEKTKSFDEVVEIVRDIASQIKGLGELYVYDTALRISANIGHEPKHVYLHAGTRVGAKRLNISTDRPYVPSTEFPKALMRLKAYEIESFLCIYKNHFGNVVKR